MLIFSISNQTNRSYIINSVLHKCQNKNSIPHQFGIKFLTHVRLLTSLVALCIHMLVHIVAHAKSACQLKPPYSALPALSGSLRTYGHATSSSTACIASSKNIITLPLLISVCIFFTVICVWLCRVPLFPPVYMCVLVYSRCLYRMHTILWHPSLSTSIASRLCV